MSLIARIATSVSAYAVSSRSLESGDCCAHLLQHLDAGHPGHPLVGDDRGDRTVLEQLVGEDLERLGPDVARRTR